jgi:hypothetical protein
MPTYRSILSSNMYESPRRWADKKVGSYFFSQIVAGGSGKTTDWRRRLFYDIDKADGGQPIYDAHGNKQENLNGCYEYSTYRPECR